jgi:acyl carrier protein
MRGELHVGGAGLARGYLGRAKQTAASFVPDPFADSPGGRLYRTGDLARYRMDGEIEFLGRADARVKLRGFRIELGEIESVVARHPSVRQVVAALRDDDEFEPRLVAYVVRDPDSRSPEDAFTSALRRFLRRSLPEYMIPAALVVLPALPLTATGKIDRRSLPSPDGVLPLLSRDYVAPRTPLEAELAAIWSKLLGVERIGVHDNFFELGGHSLLAIRVLARVQDAFTIDIPFRAIFDSPTVSGLAAVVEETRSRRARGDDLPIVPLSRADHAAVLVLDDELALELAPTDDPGSADQT